MNKSYKILLPILLIPILSFSQAIDTSNVLEKTIKKQVNENHSSLLWESEAKLLTAKVNSKIKSTTKQVNIPNNHTDSAFFYNINEIF